MTGSEALSQEIAALRQRIAELEQAAAERQQAERFQDRLLDAVGQAIIATDLPGTIIYWNRQAESLYGWAAAEVLGRNILDVTPCPEMREKGAEIMDHLRAGQTWSGEFMVRRRDGTVFPAIVTDTPIHDEAGRLVGVIGVSTDISRLRETEEALRESEARYRAISEITSDYAFSVYVEPDGRQVAEWTTNSVHRITGFTAAEIEKRGGWVTMIHPEDQPLYLDFMEGLLSGYFATGEFRILDKEDNIHWLHIESCPTWDETEDRVNHFLGAARDITEQKKAEQKLRHHQEQLEEMVQLRTAQLAAANEQLRQEVAERQRTEESLRLVNERLQTLYDIQRNILAAHSTRAIVQTALERLRHIIPYKRASVIEFDEIEHKATFLLVYSDQESRFDTDAELPLQRFPLDINRAGHPRLVEDIAATPQPSPLEQSLYLEGIRSYVNIPLLDSGELIGSLNLGSEQPDFFTPDHIEIAGEVATSLAVALRQTRLHEMTQKLYEQSQQDAKTKEMLLQEVNHRVKNNLSAIIGLLHAESRQASPADRPIYQTILGEMINRIQGMVAVHNLLSASEWSPILLSHLVAHIVQSSRQMFPTGRRLAVDISPSPVRVTANQANSLALIINELATNTLKYTDQEITHINIKITRQDDIVQLEFRDDGPGYPPQVLRLEEYNLGLYLVQLILRHELQGELSLETNQGAVTIIRFKSDCEGEQET